MERADLLEANGGIFKPQGEAIAAGAADDIKVLVVGNPANTNALIAMSPTRDGVPRERFTAMTRLDHNRAVAQLAQKTGAAVSDITNMARVGQPLTHDVPRPVQREGARRARAGTRSATRRGSPTSTSRAWASAARRSSRRAARPRPRRPPTPRSTTSTTGCTARADGDWVSMAVPSDGSYGVDEGIISSFPCRCADGEWEIVEGLDVPEFSQERIDKTVDELREERDAVAQARPRLSAQAAFARRASRARTSSPCPPRRGRASRGTGSSA